MLVKLDDPVMLSKVIDILSELVTEVRIKFNEFGLSIGAIDPANVALVKFKLPKSSFSQFEVADEVLGINLDDLKRILKRCGAGSSLILEKQENFLNIQIQDKIKRNFSLNLIEVEAEEKDMPELEYTARVEINSSDLTDSVEDCLVVADACSFIIQEGKFIIEAKGINSAMSEFSGDEAKIEAENCKVRYSLEYLQKFMKGTKLVEKTILNFAEDHPMRLDIKSEHMELNFLLAPRVENDD
jgi:proliferating cell nuclear antigen PCNA